MEDPRIEYVLRAGFSTEPFEEEHIFETNDEAQRKRRELLKLDGVKDVFIKLRFIYPSADSKPEIPPKRNVTELTEQVSTFRYLVGDDWNVGAGLGFTPDKVHQERIELRLRLFIEEVCEVLEACLGQSSSMVALRSSMYRAVDVGDLARLDFPKVVQELADVDFIVEGFRQDLGVNGLPVAREVYRANSQKVHECARCLGCSKEFVPKLVDGDVVPEEIRCRACGGKGKIALRNESGKVIKPAGWEPPDVEGALEKQGWVRP